MIYVVLASAFVANHSVSASGDRAFSHHAFSQRSSNATPHVFTYVAAHAATQQRDTASQGPASNDLAAKTETIVLPAIPASTETKKGKLEEENALSCQSLSGVKHPCGGVVATAVR